MHPVFNFAEIIPQPVVNPELNRSIFYHQAFMKENFNLNHAQSYAALKLQNGMCV